MRLRVHRWINTKSLKVRYGIQALFKGRWCHCIENGKPLFFRKEERAKAYVKKWATKS